MKLIKILVLDDDDAYEITELLSEAEEDGKIDFPFTLRITEDLDSKLAKYNLYNEVL